MDYFLLSYVVRFLWECSSGVHTREWGWLGRRAHTHFHSVRICQYLPNLIRLTHPWSVRILAAPRPPLHSMVRLGQFCHTARVWPHTSLSCSPFPATGKAEPHWVFHRPLILPLLGTAYSGLRLCFCFVSFCSLYILDMNPLMVMHMGKHLVSFWLFTFFVTLF